MHQDEIDQITKLFANEDAITERMSFELLLRRVRPNPGTLEFG